MNTFTNQNVRSRFVKALGIVMAIALVVAAVPALFGLTANKAYAAGTTVTVTDANSLQNALNTIADGGTVKLGADINWTGTSKGNDYGGDITRITVPAGKTVTLDLAGHSINYLCEGVNDQNNFAYVGNGVHHYTLIKNNGNLSIINSGNAAFLKLYMKTKDAMDDMDINSDSHAVLIGIYNTATGNVSVSEKITIDVQWQYLFNGPKYNHESDPYFECYGIYSDAGTVECNADINIYSKTRTGPNTNWAVDAHACYSRNKSFGIYAASGPVICDATNATWNVETYSCFYELTGEMERNEMSIINAGVYTNDADSSFSGVTINSTARYGDSTSGNDSGGNLKYIGISDNGIMYGENPPTIASDVNINTNIVADPLNTKTIDTRLDNKTAVVVTTPAVIGSSENYGAGNTTLGSVQSNTAGSYYDENGNLNTCGVGTGNMKNGQAAADVNNITTAKVINVYRICNKAGTTVYFAYTDRGSNTSDDGWGYYFQNAGTLLNVSNGKINAGTSFEYTGGATPINSNYYRLGRISVLGTGANYASATNGTPLKTWNADGTVRTEAPYSGTSVAGGDVKYVCFDLFTVDADSIRANLSADKLENDVTTIACNYTGRPLVPGTDFPFAIYKVNGDAEIRNDDVDISAAYNYSLDTTSKLPKVVYKYGKTAGSYTVSGMPTDAGTYYVQATIPADKTYSATSNNVEGDTFEFIITINKCQPTITGPDAITITYGTKLADIDTSTYSLSGIAGSPSGIWSFDKDTTIVAPADGEYTATLNFTPTGSSITNFNKASKTVKITATKKDLTVTPNNASIVYGDNAGFEVGDLTFIGLVYNTDTYKQTVYSELVNNLKFTGGSHTNEAYAPGFEVGNYTVTGAGDTANYNVTYGEATATVTPRDLYVTASAADREYNGTNTVTVKFNIETNTLSSSDVIGASGVYLDDDTTATVAAPAGGAPGDIGDNLAVTFAVPTLKGARAANYNLTYAQITNYRTLTVNITKLVPPVTVPTLASVTYDSTKTLADFFADNDGVVAHANLAAGEPDGVWKWTAEAAATVPTVTNYGYDLVFYPTSDNYMSVTKTATVNVAKHDITVGVVTSDIYYGDDVPTFSYTFEGFTNTNPADTKAQYILVDGQQLSAVGFTLSGENPSITGCSGYAAGSNAGDYAIDWTLGLTADNYNFVQEASVLHVNKKTAVVSANSATVTYGDAAPAFSYKMSGLKDGETEADALAGCATSVTVTSAYTSGSPVATYDIVAAGPAESTNYTFQYVKSTLTVKKATLTFKADNKTVNYGDALPASELTYTVTGFKGTDTAENAFTGTPALSTTYTRTSSCDETYVIQVNPSTCFSANYNFTSENGIVTVNRGKVTVTAWPTATVDNGQALSTAIVTGGSASVEGTFTFANPTEVLNFSTEAQSVAAVFEPANSNYDTVTGTIAVTTNAIGVSGVPTISGTLMVGETLTVSTSGMTPSNIGLYNIQWYSGETAITGATGIELPLTADLEGNVVKVTVTPKDSSGFTGKASYTSEDSVARVMTIPTLEKGVNIDYTIPTGETYDGQQHEVFAYKIDNDLGDITVRYNGSKSAPVNAGTYIVTVDVGLSAKYGPVSGFQIGTLTIEKTPIYLSFAVKDKEYDGKTNAEIVNGSITTVGKIGSDDVRVNTEAATYKFKDAAAGDGKDVEVIGAFLEGSQKGNYVIEVNDVTASITPKVISVQATAQTREYDPDLDYVDLTFTTPTGILTADKSAVSIGSGKGYLASNNASNEAIITYVDYILSGAKADNYELVVTNEDSLTAIITKATPAVTAPTASEVTYSGTQTLAQISLGDSHWSWVAPATVPQVNVGTYKAVYTPDDLTNYNTVSMDVALTVKKATAIITVNNATITYGDPKPAFSVTAEGFAGEDSLNKCGGILLYTTTYNQFNAVGNYTISAKSSSLYSPNYNFTYIDGTLIVNQKELTVTPVAVNRDYEQGNKQVTVLFNDFTGKLAQDDVTIAASVIGTVSDENAGTKSVTYALPELSGNAKNNYYLTINNPNISVDIAQITPADVTFPAKATVQAGNSLAYAEFEGQSGSGTFAFVDQGVVIDQPGIYANKYEVVFNPSDYINFKSITRYVTVTVTNNIQNVAVAISGSFYVGNKVTAAVSGMTGNAKDHILYTWYRVDDNGAKVAISNDSSYTLTSNDEGSRIRLDVSFETPYEGTGSFTSARPVEKEKLSFWEKIQRWWYKVLAALQSLFDLM